MQWTPYLVCSEENILLQTCVHAPQEAQEKLEYLLQFLFLASLLMFD